MHGESFGVRKISFSGLMEKSCEGGKMALLMPELILVRCSYHTLPVYVLRPETSHLRDVTTLENKYRRKQVKECVESRELH